MMAALLSRTKSSEDSRVLSGFQRVSCCGVELLEREKSLCLLEEGRVRRIGLREEKEDALVAVCGMDDE